MDIREFYKSTQKNQSSNSSSQHFASNSTNSNNTNSKKDFGEYEDMINKYKDLPQNELMAELVNQASSLKQQGKLDNNTLSQISSTLAPMLNDEQKQMLNNIIERLK